LANASDEAELRGDGRDYCQGWDDPLIDASPKSHELQPSEERLEFLPPWVADEAEHWLRRNDP
jgi:hypothetical protein